MTTDRPRRLRQLIVAGVIVLALAALLGGAPNGAGADLKPGVNVDREPFCDPADEDVTQLEAEPFDEWGVPAYKQWYDTDETQRFVLQLHEGKGLLRHVHGASPRHATKTLLIAVSSTQTDRLDDIAGAISDIAPDGLRILVSPTCVDPKEAARLQAKLDNVNVGVGNTRGVHALTGQLVIAGPPEAHQRLSKELESTGERNIQNTVVSEVHEGDSIARSGRMDDGSPHYGGAAIADDPEVIGEYDCSAGFTVRRDSRYFMVTAQHCEFTDAVYSAHKYFGWVWEESPGFPAVDAMLISSNNQAYFNKIHVDPCCPSVRTVIGKAVVGTGSFVCTSGVTTRAKCGHEVKKTNISVEFPDDGTTIGLIETQRGLDAQLVSGVRPGDSGGPTYVRWGGDEAAIAGMIVGGGDGTLFEFSWHHGIGFIESQMNVALATN